MSFFPLLWIIPVTTEKKTHFFQYVVHQSFRLFLWVITTLKGMTFIVERGDLLRSPGPGLIVANHPTLLDVVVLVSQLPQADCVVKGELWENIFFRGIVRLAGYIPNTDGVEVVSTVADRLKMGRKVIVFPEGTRSLPDELRSFTLGFAHIAVRTPTRIRPVVIHCHPSALTKGKGIFDVPRHRAQIRVTVGDIIDPKLFYSSKDTNSIAVRKVAASVSQYFKENVRYDGSDAIRNQN